MLSRENICWHHRRALLAHPVAGAHIRTCDKPSAAAHGHHREHRNDGLSATDVALQKRMELLFPVQACDNRIQGFFLPAG